MLASLPATEAVKKRSLFVLPSDPAKDLAVASTKPKQKEGCAHWNHDMLLRKNKGIQTKKKKILRQTSKQKNPGYRDTIRSPGWGTGEVESNTGLSAV